MAGPGPSSGSIHRNHSTSPSDVGVQPMADFKQAIAKIDGVNADGSPVCGTAFPITDRHLLTCAHCLPTQVRAPVIATFTKAPRDPATNHPPVRQGVGVWFHPWLDLAILE